MTKIFDRYFYGLRSKKVIEEVVEQCSQCNSMKYIAPELMTQTTSSVVEHPGDKFAADVMRRALQKILVVRDYHSSYTTTAIIPDEKQIACDLAFSLQQTCCDEINALSA